MRHHDEAPVVYRPRRQHQPGSVGKRLRLDVTFPLWVADEEGLHRLHVGVVKDRLCLARVLSTAWQSHSDGVSARCAF